MRQPDRHGMNIPSGETVAPQRRYFGMFVNVAPPVGDDRLAAIYKRARHAAAKLSAMMGYQEGIDGGLGNGRWRVVVVAVAGQEHPSLSPNIA